MLNAISQHPSQFSVIPIQDPVDTSVSSVVNGGEAETDRPVELMSGQKETGLNGQQKDSVELSAEAEEIRELQARDREVRAHEAAHAAAGGAYAGAPSYTYSNGPDGTSYASGGEVSIDISPVPGDPQATLMKAQQVRAAAMAPAEPSAQDMQVAQKAQAMAAAARMELAQQMSDELKSIGESLPGSKKDSAEDGAFLKVADVSKFTPAAGGGVSSGISRLDIQA